MKTLLIGYAMAACILGGFARADEFDARYQAIVASEGNVPVTERLHELFRVDWAYTIHNSPELATYAGVPGYENKWTDNSQEAIAQRKQHVSRALRVLETINPEELGHADRISYDLFKRQTEESIDGLKFPQELLPITQLGGVQQDPAHIFSSMPSTTVADLEHQVARLRALPTLIAQSVALLEVGLSRKITPPQVTLRDVPAQVLSQIPHDPFESPLLANFVDVPASVAGEAGLRLWSEAARLYTTEIVPAFRRLHEFLKERYIPGARQSIAASDLPNGAAWYAWAIRVQTSTDLTAQQIHDLGLAEVKRIREEMERVKGLAKFTGSLEEFFVFLRTDPRFYFTDKAELVRAYRDIAKRADPQLMKLFKTLPRTSYGVLPVPAYAEKSQTTAYYYPGAPEVGRPGYFFANTYQLESRPKWEMEPLTLHEAVPGHHLQIALAQELGSLPEFRRWGGYTAFVEGWGLYAESLGEEMGFYSDPYSKFGQLTYEMWRAVRLVVDTGMHALGWDRQRAIEFFKQNAGKTEHDIVVEIDRYIVWPGQALAYKLGELKIKELRAFASRELGVKFDVREFHDQVLKNGALPLSVLDQEIRNWVSARKT